jgi:hypothetical protein
MMNPDMTMTIEATTGIQPAPIPMKAINATIIAISEMTNRAA